MGNGTGATAPVAAVASTHEAATAETVFALWNATIQPPLKHCLKLTDERRRRIRARIRRMPELAEWRRLFERVATSAFCRGEIARRDGQPSWVADLDWLIRNDTTIVRVFEGRYDDRSPAGAATISDQTRKNLVARDAVLTRLRRAGTR